ncbi:MAG: hypothetical protein IT338_08300 [Thermomicrobiales bacterium]|nr:hypothetical protein [Thermomicrobiales bacterium]
MNATDPSDRSSRVEREVLEILERVEAAQSPVENLQAAVRRQQQSAWAQLRKSSRHGPALPSWLTPDVARILGAFGLAILAALLGDVARMLAIPLAIASAIVFFSIWFPSSPRQSGGGPRWRGQDLNGPEGPPPIDIGRIRRGPRRPSR